MLSPVFSNSILDIGVFLFFFFFVEVKCSSLMLSALCAGDEDWIPNRTSSEMYKKMLDFLIYNYSLY